MSKIKTHENVKGVKVLDKSAVAGQRMKDAFIRSKRSAAALAYNRQDTPSEYAGDTVEYAADDLIYDTANVAVSGTKTAVRQGRNLFLRQREKKMAAERRENAVSKDYGLYLCVIIDLFSRKVVSYRVSRKCSTQLASATFRKAFRDRGNQSSLTFHSDCGSQYVSGTFQTLLKKCGVAQSFSKSGCPHDNAVAETFFASFKKEEAYRRDYSSEADFRKA